MFGYNFNCDINNFLVFIVILCMFCFLWVEVVNLCLVIRFVEVVWFVIIGKFIVCVVFV